MWNGGKMVQLSLDRTFYDPSTLINPLGFYNIYL